jgi:hypothetical protein
MVTVFVTVTVISAALYMFLNKELEAELRAKTWERRWRGIFARLDDMRAG